MPRSVNVLHRRDLMAAAAGAGALLAGAQLLRSAPVAPVTTPPVSPESRSGGGYRLTEHVNHYYRTTLI